jgi:uncharacterized RDD family membrane protein YckC
MVNMENEKVTIQQRISSMLIDHVVMTFIVTISMAPIMITHFNQYFENFGNDNNSLFRDSNYMFYALIFGMSLYLNKDMFRGKSIAKRSFKHEVIDIKTGEVASPLKCLLRNITIPVWPIEVIAVLVNPSRRIGDYIAGTSVEPIRENKKTKSKIDFYQILLSITVAFSILYGSSFVFERNFNFENPENLPYSKSSFNEALSRKIQTHLNITQDLYLNKSIIKVYDTIPNDSIKYISAYFYLKHNYIEDDYFIEVKKEVFDAIFEQIPQSEFILQAKFIYLSDNYKQSTSRTYDWRNEQLF